MTFTEIYSHSRVLISPAREKISRKSHFSERERRFRAYFQRVAKGFFRENTAHFHFSEYYRCFALFSKKAAFFSAAFFSDFFQNHFFSRKIFLVIKLYTMTTAVAKTFAMV